MEARAIRQPARPTERTEEQAPRPRRGAHRERRARACSLALDEARAGDKVMLRACLTRAVARARGRTVRVQLANDYKPVTILEALIDTQDRMMAGILTPQEAR